MLGIRDMEENKERQRRERLYPEGLADSRGLLSGWGEEHKTFLKEVPFEMFSEGWVGFQ